MTVKNLLKYGCAALLICIFTPSGRSQITVSLEGSSTINLRNKFEYINTELRLYSWVKLNQNIDLEIIALTVDNALGEIMAGLGVPLFGKIRFTGQIGIATNENNPLRLAGSLSCVVPNFVGVMLYEWGPETGDFYKYLFIYSLKKWDLGIRGQRYRNNGVFFGYRFHENVQAYVHPGYDFEFDIPTVAIGMTATFSSR
jgi:hypothetical protein